MKNWKIGLRLGFGFGLILILLIAVVAISINRMSNLANDLDDMANRRAVVVKLANDLIAAVNASTIAMRDVILYTDEAGMTQSRAVYAKSVSDFNATIKKLDELTFSEGGKKRLVRLHELSTQTEPIEKEVLRLGGENKNAEATVMLHGPLKAAQDKLEAAVSEFIEFQMAAAAEKYDEAYANYLFARNLMIAVAVIALLIGIVAGWMITGSVVQPIRQAVALAEGVAAGDLTQKIETDRNDETGQLIKALRAMNDGLLQIVGDIRTSVETINTASQEIAAGNIDLSQRTEEQAASLEETAASMEELTSTVKQNAENAREANRLAEGASGIAQKGGEAVGQVVTTMAEINESSKKIVDIIGVIDGIAFQTNILALNAAVEAARAGEQGRGFAVVAGEVRSLAQRSAAAAKEIKSLIGDSVERVTVGTAQVDRAGITMEEVVGSIRKVTGIMGDISNASAEQSSGIEQVNTAVTQMDEVTQQNAALVEEAAAAAGSLQDQARLLMEAVNRFKLDDVRSVRSSPAPRHVANRPANKAVGHKPIAKSAHPAVAKAAQPVAAGKQDDEDWSEF
ncbi:hypothetical protein GCM10007907_32140 [Chitinimonas prasina]|uniref:HAMP domain-containing protein n=2 Tax=Chitinimonas prasina TaxID=1434937 RepID=A0ABQ5YIF1_9NEIS|nr:methyl-accepting chemotaxis protein [Chitinimonas prasina]GLR14424.1 hypothetical protein GCM10007907_32140 [Chitinimonas prasina]